MLSPSQVPLLHSVPCTYWRHPPLPSQVPSRPQVAAALAGQTEELFGATPEGTKAQSPRELRRLQALHVSPQAEVQQTPSAQNPVWHSRSQLQDSALPLDLLCASGEQVLAWATSRLPPSDVGPASLGRETKWAFLHPAAPRTAHRTRTPGKESLLARARSIAEHDKSFRIGTHFLTEAMFICHRAHRLD